ncbi:MAG: hypothetical protein M3Q76_04480 [Acidobacteriota bacterium]|nr:hypothetical protein [Acidobacteriota bacterium]
MSCIQTNCFPSQVLLLSLIIFAGSISAQESETPSEPTREDVSVVMRDLTNREPLVRQRAAEELARLASVEQRRLVEGYRWQEKDTRARLALDWALYRMGKDAALFELVKALDTKLYTQAQSYLAEIESPQVLYKFLAPANGNTQIRLLEVFARAGDAGTLETIAVYESSLDPKIAAAAQFAAREINLRLAQPATDTNTHVRPKLSGRTQPATP